MQAITQPHVEEPEVPVSRAQKIILLFYFAGVIVLSVWVPWKIKIMHARAEVLLRYEYWYAPIWNPPHWWPRADCTIQWPVVGMELVGLAALCAFCLVLASSLRLPSKKELAALLKDAVFHPKVDKSEPQAPPAIDQTPARTLPYRWGHFMGSVLAVAGPFCLAYAAILIYSGRYEGKMFNLFWMAFVGTPMGIGILRKKRYGLYLVYFVFALTLLGSLVVIPLAFAITWSGSELSGVIGALLGQTLNTIYFYKRRHEFA